METRAVIDRFLEGRRLALAGVSRDPRDFSRALLTELLAKGYDVVPVNPGVSDIDGRRVYARVQDIPEPVDGVIVMTPPGVAEKIVRDCHEAHVPRVWLHRGAGQGSVSEEAVRYCEAHGIEVVPGECPLLFLGGSVHDVHRSLRRLTGGLPLRDAEQRAAERATKALLAVLLTLELFVAAGAFYGGGHLIADPVGSPMGMGPPAAMPGFLFSSFLLPGLILLVANGLLPLAVVLGALTGRRWAVRGHMLVGMVLAGWIAVQVVMLGWISPLQPLMLTIGVALFALGWLFQARRRSMARHLAVAA